MKTIEIDGKDNRLSFPGYVEATFAEATHIGFKGAGVVDEIKRSDDYDMSVKTTDYWYWQEQLPIIGAVLLKAAPKPEQVEVEEAVSHVPKWGLAIHVELPANHGLTEGTKVKVSWEVTE